MVLDITPNTKFVYSLSKAFVKNFTFEDIFRENLYFSQK